MYFSLVNKTKPNPDSLMPLGSYHACHRLNHHYFSIDCSITSMSFHLEKISRIGKSSAIVARDKFCISTLHHWAHDYRKHKTLKSQHFVSSAIQTRIFQVALIETRGITTVTHMYFLSLPPHLYANKIFLLRWVQVHRR